MTFYKLILFIFALAFVITTAGQKDLFMFHKKIIKREVASSSSISCFETVSKILLPDIPKAGQRFSSEIVHPKLYLWDNWGFIDDDGRINWYISTTNRVSESQAE